jgi:hypothetical protein
MSRELTAGDNVAMDHLKQFMSDQRQPPQTTFPHLTKRALLEVIYDNPLVFAIEFDAWINDNEDIFAYMVERAWMFRKTGRPHFGISELWEHGRLFSHLRERQSQFKLTNAWRADVARLIMLAYPKRFPDDFFRLHRRNENLLGCHRPVFVE